MENQQQAQQETPVVKSKKPIWKKWWIWVMVIFVIIIIASMVSERKEAAPTIEGPATETEESPPMTQLPNPASVYCGEQGGTTGLRLLADGSQKGFCLFDDGSECEEWKFFREECKKGDSFCKDLCGDGICQEIVCMAIGCPCAETSETCPEDCG